jgi:hypothetical protein
MLTLHLGRDEFRSDRWRDMDPHHFNPLNKRR